jgi:RNA polymerase sigma-70 factor, ECF subfamily
MKKNEDLTRFKNGDPDLYREIYNKYCKSFIKWATWKYDIDKEVARDIFHEAVKRGFEKVCNKSQKHLDSKISTWLFAIAVNVLRERTRKEKHDIPYNDDELYREVQMGGNSAERVFEKTHLKRKADKYLAVLEPEERHILILHFFEGYDLSDIARIMELDEETVRQKKCRAFKKLKKRFKLMENGERWDD